MFALFQVPRPEHRSGESRVAHPLRRFRHTRLGGYREKIKTETDLIKKKEFGALDAASFEGSFKFWRGLLGEMLELHRKHPQTLVGEAGSQGAQIAAAPEAPPYKLFYRINRIIGTSFFFTFKLDFDDFSEI